MIYFFLSLLKGLTKEGGGVKCYVKNTLLAMKVQKNERTKKLDSEKYDSIYVELETNKHDKLPLRTEHRPPKQQATEDIKESYAASQHK